MESFFIEFIFPNKRDIIWRCIYKHSGMNKDCFNSKNLMPLLTNIQNEEKTCMLLGDFIINLLNAETNINIFEFYANISSHFFSPDIHQPTKLTKISKTLIDNVFRNSIEFKTFSGNLTSPISDNLPQLLILKDFLRKSTVTNNIVYKRNYRFFDNNEFKNDLKIIRWKNILS